MAGSSSRRCGVPKHPAWGHVRSQGKPPWTPAPSRHQVAILRKCRDEQVLLDLMAVTGRSARTKFRRQVLNPLLDAGPIEMTIADKPRSSKQRYRLTQKGRELLAQIQGTDE